MSTTAKVYCCGAETNEKTEFNTYGANVSIDSTNPKTGSRSYKLDFVENGQCRMAWTSATVPTFRSFSTHQQWRFNAEPGANTELDLWSTGNYALRLINGKKLKLLSGGNTSTGATVLAVDTYYRIEVRADIIATATLFLYINGVQELSLTSQAPANITSFIFGGNTPAGKAGGVVFLMDDLVLWLSADITGDERPPIINVTTPDYRTVNAAGSYNDFAGVGDVTNKFNNVDEVPAAVNDGDTMYNHDGLWNVTRRQSHNFVDKTVGGTLKGFTAYDLVRTLRSTSYEPADSRGIFVTDSAIDYAGTSTTIATGASYGPAIVGFQDRPGGTTLTNAALNAMNVGSSVTINTRIDVELDPPFFVTFNKATLRKYPTADSTVEDGVWSQTGGTAGSAFTAVDDTSTTDYISHNVAAVKQGFKFANPNITDGVIVGVLFQIRAGPTGDTGTNTVRCYYKGTDSNFYFTEASVDLDGTTGMRLFDEFDTNPQTGANWANADISSGEWGIEIVTINATEIQVWEYSVHLLIRSRLSETGHFIVTATGDPYTTFPPIPVGGQRAQAITI